MFPGPSGAVYEKYETESEPETSLRISERPSWVTPLRQTLKGSVLLIERNEAVQLCRSLHFRGTYLYHAAAEIQDEQVGAAAIIKYRMTTGTVKQQAIAETSTCSLASAELTAIPYTLEHARDTLCKTTHVYIATTSREALSAIEKAHKAGCGREVVPKVANAVLETEKVGHRVTVFLVPGDNCICHANEAKQVERTVIDIDS
jgi:ribonuclease HI